MMKKILNLKQEITNMFAQKIKGDIECAIDDQVVSCSEVDSVPFIGEDTTNYHEWIEEEVKEKPYTGIPAPDYLQPDPWFGDPILSKKSQELKEADVQREVAETSMKQQVTKEPDNIHQVMYNMATDNGKTTVQLNPPGGSENFQGGPNGYGWMSGKRG